MKEQSLKPVIEKLEQHFELFNKKFFGGKLSKPIITVSPDTTRGAYGWCTSWKAWTDKELDQAVDFSKVAEEKLEKMKKEEGFYEINMCAEYLARPFEQTAGTLLHEMVHLLNLQKMFRTLQGVASITIISSKKLRKHTGLWLKKMQSMVGATQS